MNTRHNETLEAYNRALEMIDNGDYSLREALRIHKVCNHYPYVPKEHRTKTVMSTCVKITNIRTNSPRAFDFICDWLSKGKVEDATQSHMQLTDFSDKELKLELERRGWNVRAERTIKETL